MKVCERSFLLRQSGETGMTKSLDVGSIRSVKVTREGRRNIPKAFEIFTHDRTFVLKAKDGSNAQQWVQCLSVAKAHSEVREECSSDIKVWWRLMHLILLHFRPKTPIYASWRTAGLWDDSITTVAPRSFRGLAWPTPTSPSGPQFNEHLSKQNLRELLLKQYKTFVVYCRRFYSCYNVSLSFLCD